jgi:cytochrome c
MKLKLIFTSCFVIAVLGNGFTAFSQTPKAKAAPAKKQVATKQEIEEGKLLISKSDCMACHNLDKKVVGPAYMDVAKKYSLTDANVNLLAQKVISGGTGVWGQIPMVPHAALSSSDSKKMVKYVLSLDGK